MEARQLLVSLAVGVTAAVSSLCQAGVLLQFDDPVSSCALAPASWDWSYESNETPALGFSNGRVACLIKATLPR